MKHHSILLALLSGFFIGTSYIPLPPWAAVFGFVPLWYVVIQQQSIKRIFFLAWITQFTLTIIGFNWVAYTAHEFGRMPWFFSILVLLAFASIANLYIPLSLLLWQWIRTKLKPSIPVQLLLMPTLTALGESFVPTIFPWNFGYTWLAYDLPIFQLSEYIGFQGISAIVIFCNLLFLLPFLKKGQIKTRRWSWFAIPVLLVVLLNGIGKIIENGLPLEDKKINVLIAQANIGNLEKVYAFKKGLYRTYILDQFLTLSEEGIKKSQHKIDLIVWPETAFPDEISSQGGSSSLYFRLANFLNLNNVPLVTGAYGSHPNTDRVSNSIFFLQPNGQFAGPPYHKTHLLPFGEYFPMGETFPWLRELVPSMGNFIRGDGPQVNNVNDVLYGPQVCYESLFPAFSVGLRNRGAQVIINLTNDSWFGLYQEPYQHMYMTLARAVENRIPMIRSTNTGISTVITASGKVLTQSPLHQPWQGTFEVPYSTKTTLTFYAKYPNLTHFALGSLFALLLLGSIVTREQQSKD